MYLCTVTTVPLQADPQCTWSETYVKLSKNCECPGNEASCVAIRTYSIRRAGLARVEVLFFCTYILLRSLKIVRQILYVCTLYVLL